MKKTLLGAAFIFLAAVAYACMGVLVKFAKEVPNAQLVFMRNLVCLLLLLPFLFFPERKSLKTSVFFVHTLRATAGLLNMYCFFYSIQYILLADAMLLNNTMPLFIPLILWIWKRKSIPLFLIPGLLIGFVGILLILHPERTIFQPAAFLALTSGFFMSISMTGVRELSRTDPPYQILFYYFAIGTCLSAFPLFWVWKNPSFNLWLVMLGIGFFAALYQFFLTKGYEKASASKISPVIYFAVVLSGFFDWLFWDVKPDVYSFIGLAFVCVGASICIGIGGKK